MRTNREPSPSARRRRCHAGQLIAGAAARAGFSLGLGGSKALPLSAMSPRMSKLNQSTAIGFTPGEREYIRRELDMFFSTYPKVAEGFLVKIWRGGPNAGKPKLSPIAKGLIDRGLMRLDTGSRAPRLFFTPEGLAELRGMMADRRFADPKKFGHIRQELGIDPIPEADFSEA
jgi:hypothetical protein